MKASPQQITNRFHEMGVLLLLDTPQHLQFGIDNITWQVGNKFKGIKLIPLGTHIITYSLKNQNHMFPVKKFINFSAESKQSKGNERIKVFRWTPKIQKFIALTGQQALGYRQGVKKYHFDSFLGAYPQNLIEFWLTNTKYITKQVLSQLDPIQQYNNYQHQYENKQKQSQNSNINNIDSGSQQQNEQIIDQFQQEKQIQNKNQNRRQKQVDAKNKDVNEIKSSKDYGGNIYYSDIPRRLSQQLSHTTSINLDRTQILQSILKTYWSKNKFNLLGELQYSFIAFLIGQCLDSYNQWKQLIIVMSSSQRAFITHKQLMIQFIAVLYQQIRQFPQDFFVDQLGKQNFLVSCLENLNIYKQQNKIGKKAISRIQKLLQLVNKKFGFTPNIEDDEPVIVEEEQSYF